MGGLLLVAALRRRVGVRLAVGAVGLAVLLPVVVPQATMDRLTSRYSAAEEDRLSGRMDIWRVAVAMAEDRPLQGQAYGGFPDAFYHYMLTADVDPYFDIPAIPSYPFNGSALIIWDSGEPAPPITNTPPYAGSDPHSDPRNDADARQQKSDFLQSGGAVTDVCTGLPCTAS